MATKKYLSVLIALVLISMTACSDEAEVNSVSQSDSCRLYRQTRKQLLKISETPYITDLKLTL